MSKTRIKLRTDTTANWRKSIVPLYEGEIAISYDLKLNPLTSAYEKKNFRIKIGKGDTASNSCLWNDAADLSIASLSEEDLQALAESVKSQLGDVFVEWTEYSRAMSALDESVNAIQQRLSNRVKAYVSDAVLMLSTDD